MFTSVTAKLHNMRKEQSFSVMTMTNGHVMIQSDRSIGTFDPATGKGRLSVKGSYFHHLAMHGFVFIFPEEFVTACKKVLKIQGPTTDLGGVIVQNTVTVIE